MNSLTKQEVYNIINKERTYQFYRWGQVHIIDGNEYLMEIKKSPEEFILYMEHFLQEARRKISTEAGSSGALNELRKVVALGVACFEQNGVPDRWIGDYITNGRNSKDYPIKC